MMPASWQHERHAICRHCRLNDSFGNDVTLSVTYQVYETVPNDTKMSFSLSQTFELGGGGTNVTMNKHRNALKTHHGRTRLHVKSTKKFVCIIAIILAMVSASIAMFSFADGDSGHGGNSSVVLKDFTDLQFTHWEDFADNRQGTGSASVTYFMNKIASNDPSKGIVLNHRLIVGHRDDGTWGSQITATGNEALQDAANRSNGKYTAQQCRVIGIWTHSYVTKDPNNSGGRSMYPWNENGLTNASMNTVFWNTNNFNKWKGNMTRQGWDEQRFNTNVKSAVHKAAVKTAQQGSNTFVIVWAVNPDEPTPPNYEMSATTQQVSKAGISTTDSDPVHDTIKTTIKDPGNIAKNDRVTAHVTLHWSGDGSGEKTKTKDVGNIQPGTTVNSPDFTPSDFGNYKTWPSGYYWFTVAIPKQGKMANEVKLDKKQDPPESFTVVYHGSATTKAVSPTGMNTKSSDAVHDHVITACDDPSAMKHKHTIEVTLHWSGYGTRKELTATKTVDANLGDEVDSPDFKPSDLVKTFTTWGQGDYWFTIKIAKGNSVMASDFVMSDKVADESFTVSPQDDKPSKALYDENDTREVDEPVEHLVYDMTYYAQISAPSNGSADLWIRDVIDTTDVKVNNDKAYVTDQDGNKVQAEINTTQADGKTTTIAHIANIADAPNVYTLHVPQAPGKRVTTWNITDTPGWSVTGPDQFTDFRSHTLPVDPPKPDKVWVLSQDGALTAEDKDWTNKVDDIQNGHSDTKTFLLGDSIGAVVNGLVRKNLVDPLKSYSITDDVSGSSKYITWDLSKTRVFVDMDGDGTFSASDDKTSYFTIKRDGDKIVATANADFLKMTGVTQDFGKKDHKTKLYISGKITKVSDTSGETVKLVNDAVENVNGQDAQSNEPAVYVWTPNPDKAWVKLGKDGKWNAVIDPNKTNYATDKDGNVSGDDQTFLDGDAVGSVVNGEVPANLAETPTKFVLYDDWTAAAYMVDADDVSGVRIYEQDVDDTSKSTVQDMARTGKDVTKYFTIAYDNADASKAVKCTATAKLEYLKTLLNLAKGKQVTMVIPMHARYDAAQVRKDYGKGVGDQVVMRNAPDGSKFSNVAGEIIGGSDVKTNVPWIHGYVPYVKKSVNASTENGGDGDTDIEGANVQPGDTVDYHLYTHVNPVDPAYDRQSVRLTDAYDELFVPDKDSVEVFAYVPQPHLERRAMSLSGRNRYSAIPTNENYVPSTEELSRMTQLADNKDFAVTFDSSSHKLVIDIKNADVIKNATNYYVIFSGKVVTEDKIPDSRKDKKGYFYLHNKWYLKLDNGNDIESNEVKTPGPPFTPHKEVTQSSTQGDPTVDINGKTFLLGDTGEYHITLDASQYGKLRTQAQTEVEEPESEIHPRLVSDENSNASVTDGTNSNANSNDAKNENANDTEEQTTPNDDAYRIWRLGIVDDYDDAYLDADAKDVRVVTQDDAKTDVTDQFNIQIKDGTLYVFAKLVDTPIVDVAHHGTIKTIHATQPTDLKAYAEKSTHDYQKEPAINQDLLGKKYTVVLPFKVKKVTDGYVVKNTATQIVDNRKKVTNEVINPLKPLEPKKDVTITVGGESVDGKEVALHSYFNYKLMSSTVPANRAYPTVTDWGITDTLDEKYDQFTGQWIVQARKDVYGKDGNVLFKAGDTIAESRAYHAANAKAQDVSANAGTTGKSGSDSKPADGENANANGNANATDNANTNANSNAHENTNVNANVAKAATSATNANAASNGNANAANANSNANANDNTSANANENGNANANANANESSDASSDETADTTSKKATADDDAVLAPNASMSDKVATYGDTPYFTATYENGTYAIKATDAFLKLVSDDTAHEYAWDAYIQCERTWVTDRHENVFDEKFNNNTQRSNVVWTKTPENPSIKLEKYDVKSGLKDGDRNSKSDSLTVDGDTEIGFLITNNGDVPLTNVTLTDKTVDGTGEVKDITFPSGWDGTLDPGESVTATGTLTGVKAGTSHTDTATVTGKSYYTGKEVSAKDDWNGQKPAPIVQTGDASSAVAVTGAVVAVVAAGMIAWRRRQAA
jgi:adhesin isopeptide-forming family sspB-C2 type protein